MTLPPYGDILHAEAAQGQLHQKLRVAQASTRRTTIPPGSRANRNLLRARSPVRGGELSTKAGSVLFPRTPLLAGDRHLSHTTNQSYDVWTGVCCKTVQTTG